MKRALFILLLPIRTAFLLIVIVVVGGIGLIVEIFAFIMTGEWDFDDEFHGFMRSAWRDLILSDEPP